MFHGEIEIQFTRKECSNDYPDARQVIITFYGGTTEECIKEARESMNLYETLWDVVAVRKLG